jgi:chitinase
MLAAVRFDILFLQFYNTNGCSASDWVAANPNYVPGSEFRTAGFTFDTWKTWLAGTPSANAKLYITLPGNLDAASAGFYITPAQARSLVSAYYCRPPFGGIGLWDATYSRINTVNGVAYYSAMKDILVAASFDTRLSCISSSLVSYVFGKTSIVHPNVVSLAVAHISIDITNS